MNITQTLTWEVTKLRRIAGMPVYLPRVSIRVPLWIPLLAGYLWHEFGPAKYWKRKD